MAERLNGNTYRRGDRQRMDRDHGLSWFARLFAVYHCAGTDVALFSASGQFRDPEMTIWA